MNIKTIPLDKTHRNLKAKMASFAGYSMPIQYEGIISEHLCVRENVGVFDVSHMGEFTIEGEGALDLLKMLLTNDPEKLTVGKAIYSCMTNEKGGIIDDLITYKTGENSYLLVVNAANIQKDFDWICSKNIFGTKLKDISDSMGLLAVQGPNAGVLLQKLTSISLAEIPYYHFVIGKIGGISDVIISATGYTGSGGFELYCNSKNMEALWQAIFKEGKSMNVKPIGLAARDTLRLEKGYCLYGNDIDDQTTPLEAGLGWVTKFNHNFTAKAILEKQNKEGVSRKLVGFRMLEKGIPRQGYSIFDEKGSKIGIVTSGTSSPSLKKGIGMGYVSTHLSKIQTTIYISIREKRAPAQVVKVPFL